MSQLLLDISPDWRPTLDNFVVGSNAELLFGLREALAGHSTERCFYIWGEAGSGKSHLLHAMVESAQQAGHSVLYAQSSVPEAAEVVTVDDVESCNAEAQIALFNLYNEMREQGGVLLVSGSVAPQHLSLRPDLRTRLGWGLIYQLQGLSEQEKALALTEHAKAKGFILPPDVAQYLLNHGRRDLPSLLATLDALDELSLRLHRAPSVPLLKQVMQSHATE
jgi:DnaA family protein